MAPTWNAPSSPASSCWLILPNGCTNHPTALPTGRFFRDSWGEANANAASPQGCSARCNGVDGWCGTSDCYAHFVSPPPAPPSPASSCWLFWPTGCNNHPAAAPVATWIRDLWGEANQNANTPSGCAARGGAINAWCGTTNVLAHFNVPTSAPTAAPSTAAPTATPTTAAPTMPTAAPTTAAPTMPTSAPTPTVPTGPYNSCWIMNPSGCTSQPFSGIPVSDWWRDAWGENNVGANTPAGCASRPAALNSWCGVSDIISYFVHPPAVPTSPLHSCWLFMANGCTATTTLPSGEWFRDFWGEANAGANTLAGCTARVAGYNGWCGLSDTLMHFVAPTAAPTAAPTNVILCPNPPCAAALLGDVGLTTVGGSDARTGKVFQPGENIYGPFEAGFTSKQDSILGALGCSPASNGYTSGGIDTRTSEQMIAHQCSVTLPRIEGPNYVSLLDECGGHTNEYHFHQRLSCLYAESGAHSAKVGEGLDLKALYGKWEDYSTLSLPALDACGGHFGPTPESNGLNVYHYHTQSQAPFTFGCYGPSASGGLVSVAECKALYTGCGDNDVTTVATATGNIQYDPWCPCFDAQRSNVGSGYVN